MAGRETRTTYSRAAVAEWAGISDLQLEYLVKQGVLVPDVGGARKRFSLLEARMAVIAGALLRVMGNASDLKEPIAVIRAGATFPDAGLPRSFAELSTVLEYEGAKLNLEHIKKFNIRGGSVIRDRLIQDLFAERHDYFERRDEVDPKKNFMEETLEQLQRQGKRPEDVLAPIVAEIDERLAAPMLWDEATYCKIVLAFDFEKAFRGKGNFCAWLSIHKEKITVEYQHTSDWLGDAETAIFLNISKIFSARDVIM